MTEKEVRLNNSEEMCVMKMGKIICFTMNSEAVGERLLIESLHLFLPRCFCAHGQKHADKNNDNNHIHIRSFTSIIQVNTCMITHVLMNELLCSELLCSELLCIHCCSYDCVAMNATISLTNHLVEQV